MTSPGGCARSTRQQRLAASPALLSRSALFRVCCNCAPVIFESFSRGSITQTQSFYDRGFSRNLNKNFGCSLFAGYSRQVCFQYFCLIIIVYRGLKNICALVTQVQKYKLRTQAQGSPLTRPPFFLLPFLYNFEPQLEHFDIRCQKQS